MSVSKPNAYSFVVKIWQERREVEGGEPLWRGRVDYVQGGARVYFHRLEQLVAFLSEVTGYGIEGCGDTVSGQTVSLTARSDHRT